MEESNEISLPQGATPEIPRCERERIVDMVRTWGGCTTDAVLDPAMKTFEVTGIEGFIAYRNVKGCAIVYGDPICRSQDKAELALAFHRFSQQQDFVVVYIATSQEFARWSLGKISQAILEFGQELLFDPSSDPRKKTGPHAQLVRRKTRQAAKEGVTIHEYGGNDAEVEKAMEQVGEEWLKSRTGHQIHISDVYLFNDRLGKRWIYAKKGEKIIGAITLNRLIAHDGWLLNHLMITPDAPNGTSELLIVSAFEILEKEDCHLVTVGMVTTNELGEIQGFGKISTGLARWGFRMAKKIANLDGLYTFWGKYDPQGRPAYLIFSRNKIGLREFFGLKSALYGGNRG